MASIRVKDGPTAGAHATWSKDAYEIGRGAGPNAALRRACGSLTAVGFVMPPLLAARNCTLSSGTPSRPFQAALVSRAALGRARRCRAGRARHRFPCNVHGKVITPSMNTDGLMGGIGPEPVFQEYTTKPVQPAVADFWDHSCELLGHLTASIESARSTLEEGDVLLDRWVGPSGVPVFWNAVLLGLLQVMEQDSKKLVQRCSRDTMAAWCALDVVRLWTAALEEPNRSVTTTWMSAKRYLYSCPPEETRRKASLTAVHAFLDGLRTRLLEYDERLRALVVELLTVLAARSPVTHEVASEGLLLPAGQQRAPQVTLMPQPARDERVLIARDTELVFTLVHLAKFTSTRVAWYLASSPGMGKTHFVWDLLEALADIDHDRFAQAAQAAQLPRWHTVVESLKHSRVCVVSFNGLCAWSSTDDGFIKTYEEAPMAVFLPIYLRIFWCLRCNDGCDFGTFCNLINKMLRSNAVTVDEICREALDVLKDQPTIIVVEELSKVPLFKAVYDGDSPAENIFMVVDTESRQSAAVQLSLLYRHELCTLTRSSLISMVFTTPCPGMLLQDVRALLDDSEQSDERAALDAEVDEIIRKVSNASTAIDSLLVTSMSSRHRKGSPYYILCAVKVGFLDWRRIATVFFLPLFRGPRVVHMSEAYRSSYKQPARLSAEAFAWISGGHPRSAAVLRDKLEESVGPVWSSVVVPAAEDLSDKSKLDDLLDDLLSVPVVVLAAVHNCTLNAELPLSSGINLKGSFKTWDDLFADNILTDAVSNSAGAYKDPCMPPLFLVALLRKWNEQRSSLEESYSSPKDFIRLRDVMDALLSVYTCCDSTGGGGKVWEYVSLWADITLTRLRAASPVWSKPALGLLLPHDYESLTLSDLYPGTRTYHTGGPYPLLDTVLFNAVPEKVMVDDDADADAALDSIPAVLARDTAVLVSTVFKCKPEQTGFDYLKFLPSETGELFAICTSCKYTGVSQRYLNIESDVRSSLMMMEGAFGDCWEQWKHRSILVVATNLRTAKKPKATAKLAPTESSRVIIIGRDNHLAMYGRALSGFVGQGPALFGSTLKSK